MFCISICCGDAVGAGVGEAAGVCIPGMLPISVFCAGAAGVGEAAGIFMPGMFCIRVCPADGEGAGVGDLAGIPIPRMFMPLVPFLFGARRALRLRRALDLALDLAFRFDCRLAFGFDIFMPGMSCIL